MHRHHSVRMNKQKHYKQSKERERETGFRQAQFFDVDVFFIFRTNQVPGGPIFGYKVVGC